MGVKGDTRETVVWVLHPPGAGGGCLTPNGSSMVVSAQGAFPRVGGAPYLMFTPKPPALG